MHQETDANKSCSHWTQLVSLVLVTGFSVALLLTFHVPQDLYVAPEPWHARQAIKNHLLDRNLNAVLNESLAVSESDSRRLNHTKALANKLLNLIRHRYELGDSVGRSFFLSSNNLADFEWDLLKYKYAAKYLESNAYDSKRPYNC